MNRKKLLITGLSLLLVAAVSVGATLAYFTDTSDAKANVFTMGHVSVELVDASNKLKQSDFPNNRVVTDDPNNTADGLQYVDVLPGDIIDKTVGVTLNADSMEAWLAIKVDVTATPAEGSTLTAEAAKGEILKLIADQADGQLLDETNPASGKAWEKVTQSDGSVIYYFTQVVAPDYNASTDTYSAVTKTLFDRLEIPGADWKNDHAGLGFTIQVQAAAVQADNVTYEQFKAMPWNEFEQYPVSSTTAP